MSLLLNMLSRLVITFLPRSKHLLLSWLQSPSVVILEPRKIKSGSGLPCPPAMPSSQTRDQTHISLHLLLMQVDSLSLAPREKALFNPAAFQIQSLSCLPANAHRVIKQQMNANVETPERPITHILADFWFFLDVEKDCGCDKLHSLQLLTFCKTISSL